MEKTSMTALIVAIIGAITICTSLIIGTNAAQQEGTKQLTACVESGGSYMTVSGNPVCIMPGQPLPQQ